MVVLLLLLIFSMHNVYSMRFPPVRVNYKDFSIETNRLIAIEFGLLFDKLEETNIVPLTNPYKCETIHVLTSEIGNDYTEEDFKRLFDIARLCTHAYKDAMIYEEIKKYELSEEQFKRLCSLAVKLEKCNRVTLLLSQSEQAKRFGITVCYAQPMNFGT